VVTEYNGDPALEQAQKVVPDAYVRNFSDGARIQLGAFDDPGKADALVEQLNKEGIPAKVEQH
jgi:cell division septation protein DedD